MAQPAVSFPSAAATTTFAVGVTVLSVMGSLFPSVTHHLALVAPMTYSGGDMLRIPHVWNLITCHFFDPSLIRLTLCLPIILGLFNELNAFHTTKHLLLFLTFAAFTTGLTAFAHKIFWWLTIQSEAVFFSASASLLAILGSLVVAFAQAHLPASVSPGAALMPLPGISSASPLPATPIAAPPVLFVFPVFSRRLPTNSDASSTDLSGLGGIIDHIQTCDVRFVSVNILDYLPIGQRAARPLLRQISALPWHYTLTVGLLWLVSKVLLFVTFNSSFDLQALPRVFSFLFDSNDVVFAAAGSFYTWLFLRYFAFYVATGQRGDSSPEFSVAILLPPPLKPIADRTAAACCAAANACGFSLKYPDNAVAPRIRNASQSSAANTAVRSFPVLAGVGVYPSASAIPSSAPSRTGGAMLHHLGMPPSSGHYHASPGTPAERALRDKGLMILERHIEEKKRASEAVTHASDAGGGSGDEGAGEYSSEGVEMTLLGVGAGGEVERGKTELDAHEE